MRVRHMQIDRHNHNWMNLSKALRMQRLQAPGDWTPRKPPDISELSPTCRNQPGGCDGAGRTLPLVPSVQADVQGTLRKDVRPRRMADGLLQL